ncbi:MAG: hypothetical protein ACRD5B_05130 [Nitrososphaeraceae archaeon]|jgi:hypothetical protein
MSIIAPGLLPNLTYFSNVFKESFSVFLIKNVRSYLDMGKWKCIWCSKILEGESFMDLVAASVNEEGGQHVHGWENITLVEEETKLANKLLPNLHF